MNQVGATPWPVDLSGVASTALTDNVAGSVRDIHLVAVSFAPFCTFRIRGTANATLRETPVNPPSPPKQDLEIWENAGHLTLSNVSGCSTLPLTNGSMVSMSTRYQFATPAGYINVTP
jgi:hypothetical protein